MKDLITCYNLFEHKLNRKLTEREKEFTIWLHEKYVEEQTLSDEP